VRGVDGGGERGWWCEGGELEAFLVRKNQKLSSFPPFFTPTAACSKGDLFSQGKKGPKPQNQTMSLLNATT